MTSRRSRERANARPWEQASGRGHNFDDDAVCTDCGFDAAEWHHWKHSTYEGKAKPEARPPLCTNTGRPVDVWPLPDEDQIGDWSDGTGERCPNTGDMFEQEGDDE
ncbi:MAG: hypothetical protein KGN32_17135 [Burkholderiales bacterium]|nr:hypothetical protein [Burkholderiales bacterium]